MPCARHGWKHKDNVTVKQRWAIRLVKDITRDSILAGQECVCSECRKEHEQLNKHYLAAKSASVDESILGKLKAKVDGASYNQPDTDLPPLLRQWKRTDTRRKPCTFSGIDFEMQNLRADAGGKGIPILALRSDADFNAVMRVPELVLRYDWPAFARETGVYTNEKHLRDLVKCCFVKSLTEALKERGR